MINKEVIKQLIQDSRKDIESLDIVHRETKVDDFDCYIFVGVRRAGKSFVLYEKMQQLLKEGYSWNDMLYINFEDDHLIGMELQDIDSILECHLELGGVDKPMLFFDEIQNIDGWEKFARRVADKKYKVWITGSNAKMLSKEMLSSLGGRFLPIEVYPFSFTEYLNSLDIPFDENTLCSTKGKTDIMKLYNEYICWGGLPECIGMKVKRNYISAVYQKIYLGDICTRNKISNQNLLRLMIKKLSESVKQPISYSRIAKILSSMGGKISIPTTSNYISYCEDAWLLLRLHNISASFAEKETNSKYYFIDNGILSLLLTDANTTLLENAVALELFRKYGHDTDNERVFFYNNNVEIDFYVPEDDLAIQVSYSVNGNEYTMKREVEALQKLPSVLDCKQRLIITFDERDTIEDKYGKIEIIPFWEWVLNRLW